MDLTREESYEQPRTAYLRTPRFAIGRADAKLGLPSATVLSPFVALHNFGQSALNVGLAVRYPSGGSTQTVNIPVAVAANNTVVVPLMSHLNGVVPADVSWASLEVSYWDNQNSLAAALVSVSEDGAHSLRSVLNWVEGSAREGWFWRVDANHNTLISMLNTDTEEARVAIALDYQLDGESRSYRLPERTLAAKASSVVDVGEIITTGQPDAEGNVIPASVGFGGYQVRKLDVRADQTLTTEALVFDRRSKNFLSFYNTCCGITPGSVGFFLSDFTGTAGFIGTAGAQGQDYCGAGTVSLPATFSSGNPAVSTVSSAGDVTGVSPGSTFTNTSVTYFKQKTVDTCTNASQSNSAPTNVQVPTSLTVLSTPVLPTGTTGDHGCTPTDDFGIELDVKYQVKDQYGQPIRNATMVPHEHVVSGIGDVTDNDVCPSRVSTCTHTTDASGTWHDAPYGACADHSFSGSFTQDITIILNGVSYPVRTNNVSLSSSSSGHGSISNGGDINKSR